MGNFVEWLLSIFAKAPAPVAPPKPATVIPYWPHDDNDSLIAFYGAPGTTPLVDLQVPWKMVDADSHRPVSSFKVHPRCHAAFVAAFEEIWSYCKQNQATIERYHLHLFGGCYNPRMVRGSTTHWSVHAFAAAIDINPDGAPMGSAERPTQENLPDFAVAAFKRQGATWGGDFSSRRDWMHFQFVKERP